MSKQLPLRPHLRRELALYRYSMALERGDFATVAAVLQQAEQDAVLARLLAAWDQHLLSEKARVVGLADPLAARQVLAQFIASSPATAASNGHLSTTYALSDHLLTNLPSNQEISALPDHARSPLPPVHPQPGRLQHAGQRVEPPHRRLFLPSVARHHAWQPGRLSWMTALLALVVVVVLFVLLFHTLALSQTAHPAIPVTATPSPLPLPFVHGTTAYLIDAGTGQVLFNDQVVALPIASTAEIMTALVAIEQGGDLANTSAPITQAELDEVPAGCSSAGLVAGDDNLSILHLLYGLLLPSGCDAAVVLAHAIAGSTAQFVAMMNARAHALGLRDTHFTSPYGTERTDQSSVADLVTLARDALQNSTFAAIVGTTEHIVPAQTHRHGYNWKNTNQLLDAYPGADGVKGGSSSEAGYCLVFSALRNGRRLIGAELGAPTANLLYADATALLNWGFSESRR